VFGEKRKEKWNVLWNSLLICNKNMMMEWLVSPLNIENKRKDLIYMMFEVNPISNISQISFWEVL
jgi:hypothetical protein